jgi:hypothetical protein
MLPSEIRFLHPSTSAPYASLGGWPINDRVLIQQLIIRGHNEAACADNAVGRYPYCVMHACACRDRIEVAHARRFDTYKRGMHT